MLIDIYNSEITVAHLLGVKQSAKAVIADINLQIRRGELVYLIGKVGSGKSTLLKSLYGEIPICGERARVLGFDLLTIRNKEIPFLRRKLGVVFQDFQLLPDRNIYENMRYVLEATKIFAPNDYHKRICEVLHMVKLERKSLKMPYELSGGEQQRAAIARALLNNPELIIADEPSANLDPETSQEIISLFADIAAMGCGVILGTHDLSLIESFPSRTFRIRENILEEIDVYEIFGFERSNDVVECGNFVEDESDEQECLEEELFEQPYDEHELQNEVFEPVEEEFNEDHVEGYVEDDVFDDQEPLAMEVFESVSEEVLDDNHEEGYLEDEYVEQRG